MRYSKPHNICTPETSEAYSVPNSKKLTKKKLVNNLTKITLQNNNKFTADLADNKGLIGVKQNLESAKTKVIYWFHHRNTGANQKILKINLHPI